MSDHSDFRAFLKNLDKLLDTVREILYTAKCRIRVEQELIDHGKSTQEKVSGPAESDALSSELRQGGPELFPGSTKEKTRSQNAAEKVAMSGGRMHGRS